MIDIVTGLSELRASLPSLTGQVALGTVPLNEAMWGAMRNDQDTGIVEVYGRRFGEPHQRNLTLFPQGVSEYNGVYLTSWYYRASDPAGEATKILIVDPVTNMSGAVGLVYESGGLLYPSERHAGGIAVIGNYLYVVDSPRGIHVYDLASVYPIAGNEAVLSSHPAFSKYDYFMPKVGYIEINNTPENVGLAYLSISGDGQYFICGNYYLPNSGYAGTKSYVFKIPIDTTVAEFPAAQVGVPVDVIEPTVLSGSNAGTTMTALQGALLTAEQVLIMSRGNGTGTYQLIVHDQLHPQEFFCGNTVDGKANSYKNWLMGCEDLCFTSDGNIATVTELYDWRDIAVYSLADVIGLMGVYLPPTIAEHQAALAVQLSTIADLQAAADFYQLQINTAISEGLTRFDEQTYLL